MPDELMTDRFDRLAPGDTVMFKPVRGITAFDGQVVAITDDSVVTFSKASPTAPVAGLVTIPFTHIEAVIRHGNSSLPPTLIRTYGGKQQADTTEAFQRDAAGLAAAGYEPTSQSWAQGQWGCGAFLVGLLLAIFLIGILMLIYLLVVKPEGTLTVTYARKIGQPSLAEGETKVCPRCAETIKAAATVCRFCGHEFGVIEP